LPIQAALYSAATNGHLEIAKLLLEHGADPNVALHFGETPLMAASRRNRLKPVDRRRVQST